MYQTSRDALAAHELTSGTWSGGATNVQNGTLEQQTSDLEALYSSDQFRMYYYKVLRCSQHTAHDWSSCPFAHVNEKAARRDISLFKYDSVACPDVLATGRCNRGNHCKMAHSVFEYWLHPQRYRTQMCREGPACRRQVCFFAHSQQQLRHVPGITNDSPDPFSKSGRRKSAAAKYSLASLQGITPTPTAAAASQPGSGSSSPAMSSRCSTGTGSSGSSRMTAELLAAGYTMNSSVSSRSPAGDCFLDPAAAAAVFHTGIHQSAVPLGISSACLPVAPVPLQHVKTTTTTSSSSTEALSAAALVDLLAGYQQQVDACKQQAALAAAEADLANSRLAAAATAMGICLAPNAATGAAAAAVPVVSNSILACHHDLGLSGSSLGVSGPTPAVHPLAAGIAGRPASLSLSGTMVPGCQAPAAAAAALSGLSGPSLTLSGAAIPAAVVAGNLALVSPAAAPAMGQFGGSSSSNSVGSSLMTNLCLSGQTVSMPLLSQVGAVQMVIGNNCVLL